jgi:transcriptional regulator of arginine metabolism
MLKRYRQEQILKLIRSRPIHTQEELAERLRRQGVHTTQVTLSRDIHELGLAKTVDGYRELAAAERAANGAAGRRGDAAGPARQPEHHLKRVAGQFLRDVRRARNILVLQTDPGNAQPVALALDRENWLEIVGTLAGDDTIMAVCPSNEDAAAARSKLLSLIGP